APARLEAVLQRALLTLGAPEFLTAVLVPLLEQIGDRWHTGELSVGHEHAATTAIERVLGWLLRELPPGERGC
ncbi:MAG: B12-binding domain-containing protein, partial [Gemmatimonadales bacterium]|nr:B12-binding domain-containing protein [Gemmatimonadales bacterium]